MCNSTRKFPALWPDGSGWVDQAWVLGGAPGWNAGRAHQALERLLNTAGVEVEAASILREALEASTGSVGLADNLIVLASRNRGCSHLLTFDRRLAGADRASLLKT